MPANYCTQCGASLQGPPIPEHQQHHHGPRFYRREIGVELRGVYDGVLYWRCPDCAHAWPRDFGRARLTELSERHAAEANAARLADDERRAG